MSLLEDLFNFISQKRALAQKAQQSQAIKAFILEPILTPSGLVDDLTDSTDLMAIAPSPGIDHHFDFPPDNGLELDHAHDPDFDFPTTFIAPENIDPLPFYDPAPAIPSIEGLFNAGIFTVGESGQVSIDYLFDGGGYQGQLAIFNLNGMEDFDLNTESGLADFIHEAASRALSNSDLGHVVIADATEGAKFSGLMPSEWENHNFGEYQGVKTFDMQAGDRFAVMLVPNGTVQQVLDGNQDADIRPLFSLNTVNPNEAFHAGQIADVTGDGNTFVLEDLRTDGTTDRDYNDIIFQVRGATGTAAHLDDVINPELDWRHSDTGHAIIEYAKAYVEPVNPVETSLPIAEVPVSHQPLIGIIDTGFSANNPDIDYSRLILGRDYIDGDNNPLLVSGEGSEHGTHILGIIGATQNNGEGIDGINDDAPIWVSRAVGSGKWADSLVEFVDQARETNQPHAIANLSLDLTQINPDGSVTTRYEFTPIERAAIEYARQNGVLIVTAAGNDGGVMSALGQASQEFDNIITVGAAERVNDSLALSEAFNRTDYSSYGYGLDIVAPGGTVDNPELSTVGDGVGTLAGTSIATAKVTGAASQVWAANPDLSYRQVIEILKDTSTDLNETGWDAETGTGLLNIAAAVSLAKVTIPEEYDVLATVIPDTWSGEGIVTPTERAADTTWVNFSGIVGPDIGVNKRYSTSFGDRSPYSEPQGKRLYFDAWTYGEVGTDMWLNTPDARWFKIAGTNYWVPSCWIDGNPPNSSPMPPATQPQPQPQPQPTGDSIVYLSTSGGAILRLDTTTGQQSQIYQGRAFTDLAVAPNGKLYGCTFDSLFEINPNNGQETFIGQFTGLGSTMGVNSLTFSPNGKLYGADSNNGNVFEISPQTAATTPVIWLGALSSGDMVVNSANELLATVTGTNGDRLVTYNLNTRSLKSVDLGFSQVYGLAIQNGQLSAYTSNGQKLLINPSTGASTVVGTVASNGQIWGTGDSPNDNNLSSTPVTQPPQQPSTGNGQNIIDAVKKVNPNQWYYEPRDITGDRINETFCNWFAADVLDQLGVPIPRDASAGSYTKPHPIYGTNTPAKPYGTDRLLTYMNGGGDGMWERVSAADAVSSANNGQVVLACSVGHVAVVIPGGSGSNVRIAQAGATNGQDMTVSKGFGSITPTYFRYKGSVKGSVSPNTNTSYSPPATPGQTRQYIIKSGDTLSRIAQRELGNANRWTEIKKADGSTFTEAQARLIQPGQSVYLPVTQQVGTGKPITSTPISVPVQNINLKPGASNLNFSRGQQWITSTGYKFIFQNDGNLVLYNPQGKPIWATGTEGTGVNRLSVQTDGNVVLYDGNTPFWASNTAGNPGASFAIQNDGNLVVYSSSGNPIFNTGTNGGREGTRSASAQWLRDRNLKRFPGLQFSTVISKATGKALDAGGSNNSVYPHSSPNSGNEFHQWGFEKVGDDYMIINKATGKALDAGGGNNTLPYIHPDPNTQNPFHLWNLQQVGDAYMIVNKATGKALDSGGDNGNQIYMHPNPMSWNPFHLWKLNLPNGGNTGHLNNPLVTRQGAQYFKDRPQFYTTGNIFAQSMYGSSLVGGRGYTEGNCTWYAHGRLLQMGKNPSALRTMSGNANQWHNQMSNGTGAFSSPQVGDIAQWTANGANHVAVVEQVHSNGTITISESHYGTNWDGGGSGTLHWVRTIPASSPTRYIRVPNA